MLQEIPLKLSGEGMSMYSACYVEQIYNTHDLPRDKIMVEVKVNIQPFSYEEYKCEKYLLFLFQVKCISI